MRIVTALLGLLLLAPPAGAACTGDCNGDGNVDIGDLIAASPSRSGSARVVCLPGDRLQRQPLGVISELIAAVNVALAGCPVVTPTAVPTATPTGGVDAIFPGRLPRHVPGSARLPPQHRARRRQYPRAHQSDRRRAVPAQRESAPLGSVVIKEEYAGSNCSNDNDLVRWRVMRKEAPGFDPDDGDWHWQWVDAPSRACALRRQGHLHQLPPGARLPRARLHVHRRADARSPAPGARTTCPARCSPSPAPARRTCTPSAPIPRTAAARSCSTTTAPAGIGSTPAPPAISGGSASCPSMARSISPATVG
jgi:hypothetical protein